MMCNEIRAWEGYLIGRVTVALPKIISMELVWSLVKKTEHLQGL